MEFIKKYLFLTNEKKVVLLGVFVLFFLTSIFEILGISLVGGLIGAIVNFEVESNTQLFKLLNFFKKLGFNFSDIKSIGTVLFIILIIRFMFQVIANYLILHITNNTVRKLRENIVSSYLYMDYEEFTKKDSSSAYNEITTLTDQFGNLLLSTLRLASDFVLLIFISLLLIYINPEVFLILLTAVLTLFLLNKLLLSKKISSLGARVNNMVEQTFKNLKDGLTGYKQIKVLNKTFFVIKNIKKSLKKYTSSVIKYNFYLIFLRYFIELLIAILLILTSIFIYEYYNNTQSIVIISIFGVSAIRSLPIITSFINSFNVMFYSRDAINKLYATIKNNKEIKNFSEDETTIRNTKSNFESLEIQNLSFGYRNSELLQNINLKISSKDLIYITGPSGSGKTTLIDIICGLLKPGKGKILFNGNEINKNFKNLRDKIYYLPQKSFLINDTVEKNITFTENNIDTDRLNRSIKLSGLKEFFQKEKNNKKLIGEGGSSISGGESQRIALARALYADREILILDEFTNALDEKNENMIFETIIELNKYKTFIVISHKASIKKLFKRAYKIENKSLVELK